MKNVIFACAIFTAGLLSSAVQADVFNGNGGTSFGGTLGGGDLNLAVTSSTVEGTLNKGAGDLNDFVVIYIDSVAGGQTGTGSFTDSQDDHRKAISGFDGGSRSVVNFASGFEADYAIAINSGFAGLWALDNVSNFTFVDAVDLSPTGTNTATDYSFDFDFAEIGITSLDSFDFVATYLSNTAFRSNEAIGASDAPSGSTQIGNGTLTFSGSETFSAIPEPTSVAVLLGVGLVSLVPRRRV